MDDVRPLLPSVSENHRSSSRRQRTDSIRRAPPSHDFAEYAICREIFDLERYALTPPHPPNGNLGGILQLEGDGVLVENSPLVLHQPLPTWWAGLWVSTMKWCAPFSLFEYCSHRRFWLERSISRCVRSRLISFQLRGGTELSISWV